MRYQSVAAALQVIQTAEQASAVLQPERMKLLELLSEPDSASGLARKLGAPRQRVNYHVQLLEKEGFLELAGGAAERQLHRTGATANCQDISHQPGRAGAIR